MAQKPAKKTARPRTATSRSGKSKASEPSLSLPSISPERKLDIIGVVLALVGLLLTLSLLSSQRSTFTGGVLLGIRQVAGWGSFVLPIALIISGLWLVFRHLDRLPMPSAERLTGLILLYINILGWMHLLAGGGWELAQAGQGGGYIGGFFDWILEQTVGLAGAVVVFLAWMLVALAMALDVSIPELFRWVKYAVRPMEDAAHKLAHPPASRPLPSRPAPAEISDLPADFEPFHPAGVEPRPLPQPVPAEKPGRAPRGRAAQAAEASSGMASDGTPSVTQPQTGVSATQPIWRMPTIEEILDPPTPQAVQSNVDVERGRLIEETLASFGAPAHIVEIHRGPTVTQFGVEPDFVESRSGRTRVRVSKIAALADDLALALAAPRIRIQAPVPGRNYVGIEVANTEASRVAMREILESAVFKRVRSTLRFTLGKDVAGAPAVADLAAMPHLLIAGTTGSGKSVCVNSILCSLLLNNTPNELRLVLVDPKRVELTNYNGIPHLLSPVVTDTEKVSGALAWMQREMDARYHRFSQVGARNIVDYNSKQATKLPYIVMVIDELADLMMLAPDETERAITRLAQLARATGIHLIIATQRPSVDVVTGLIKANFPARIAFAVASGTDSRVILDQPGAERLLGRGDMLFQAPDAPAPVRLQGVYVSDPEIQRLVDTWRTTAAQMNIEVTPTASGEPVDLLPSGVPLRQVPLWDEAGDQNADPLYSEAVELVRREGRASITMLQRRMRIGYTRAARLVDAMEEKGVVGPPVTGSQVREVLDYGDTAPPEDDGY
jgi:S-DNA-T family DNA segregation ATPase FtsK/SpoIIIE